MKVLSIETSCDDTSVAVVDSNRFVHCCLVASQDLLHQPFGGIVPEIASRNHTDQLLPLIDKAIDEAGLGWNDIDGICVTNRPGLLGSLIVGLVTAKTLSLAKNIPYIGVHHIEGHIVAPFLNDKDHEGANFLNEEFLALIVSGGHTQLYLASGFGKYKILGQTMDDAAGEAFDKFGKLLGLPYPGGVQVDKASQAGDAQAFQFPRPLIKEDNFDFSFSGLKSSAQRTLDKLSDSDIAEKKNDLCASYQQAIVDVLTAKVEKAVKKYGVSNLVVSGGVSANSALRNSVMDLSKQLNLKLAIPPLRYCTDNGAMIGLAGLLRLEKGEKSDQETAPLARASIHG